MIVFIDLHNVKVEDLGNCVLLCNYGVHDTTLLICTSRIDLVHYLLHIVNSMIYR